MDYCEELEKRVELLEDHLSSYRFFIIKHMEIQFPFGYEMSLENTESPCAVYVHGPQSKEIITLTAPYEAFLHIGINRSFFQFIHERLPKIKGLDGIYEYIIDYRSVKRIKESYDKLFVDIAKKKKIRVGAKLREMCDKIEAEVEGRIF